VYGIVFSFQAPTWLKNELKEGIIPGGQGQDDSEDDSDSEEADSETEETDTGKVLLVQVKCRLFTPVNRLSSRGWGKKKAEGRIREDERRPNHPIAPSVTSLSVTSFSSLRPFQSGLVPSLYMLSAYDPTV